jgi:pyrroloquinoline quinone biosynthesis protein B
MKQNFYALFLALFLGTVHGQELVVLGTLQDGGSPHMGCEKSCCSQQRENDFVSCLGVVAPDGEGYLFDATPDFVAQTNVLKNRGALNLNVFLTHAHMGHYSGLMHLGREAQNAKEVPVYAMPRMAKFLETNGPWDQLVQLANISIVRLTEAQFVDLGNGLKVKPLLVPHRDEYSETVGYVIQGPEKSALFIPDIDKWHLWERNILDEIRAVDYAFLDATFMSDGEVPRPMAEVPHPFIEESVALMQELATEDRNKVYFIHLNHSNPARNSDDEKRQWVEKQGFHFAAFGQAFSL